MTDVYIVTLSLLGILISLPALLVAVNLLLPNVTTRAYTRLTLTPVKSFFFGLPLTAVTLLWIIITAQASVGIVRATAVIVALLGMGVGTIGAAGMARLLGAKLAPLAAPNSELMHTVRGAVLYELACLVPFVGWFLFIPIAGVTLVGAATFALLHWVPQTAVAPITQLA